jgi:hypothetical protein
VEGLHRHPSHCVFEGRELTLSEAGEIAAYFAAKREVSADQE